MSEWRWVQLNVVLAIHDRLLAEDGGSEGLLSMGGLEGALARPANRAAYGDPDLAELAATYALGVAKAHAFLDGNKRTAWAIARVFLRLNGYIMGVEWSEAAALMVQVADNEVAVEVLAAWYRARIRQKQ